MECQLLYVFTQPLYLEQNATQGQFSREVQPIWIQSLSCYQTG